MKTTDNAKTTSVKDSETLFPLQYVNEIIQCKNADDRKVLQEAILVAEDSADVTTFTAEQFRKMSEKCKEYGLTNLQQVTSELAERAEG
jgi:hypothetical protein